MEFGSVRDKNINLVNQNLYSHPWGESGKAEGWV